MTKIAMFAGALIAAVSLNACGGGSGASSLPAAAPGNATPASVVTSTGGNVNSASAGPIAGDPLPSSITPGTTYTFATCVPVFNDLAYTSLGWQNVGCAPSATAESGGWVIDGNYSTSLDCILRYETVSDDIVEFFCAGNPY